MEPRIKELEEQLKNLRRHTVYGFFTSDKKFIYPGQTKDFDMRLLSHFENASKTNPTQPFHKKLAEQLKSGGVYAIKLFDKLTDLEADEIEYFLIQSVKLYNAELAGNVSDGNITSRINELAQTPAAFKREMNNWYEAALKKIESVGNECFYTEKPAKKIKAWSKSVKSLGACKRANCPFGARGLVKDGYCLICHKYLSNLIKEAKTLPPYDSSTSTLNHNYNNNQAQKALTSSMRKLNSSFGKARITPIINKILGDRAAKIHTVDKWINSNVNSITKSNFDLKKFLHVVKSEEYALSQDSVEALVVYEHMRSQTVEQASSRLSELFEDDKSLFPQEDIEAIYDDIENVKERLVALFPDAGPVIKSSVVFEIKALNGEVSLNVLEGAIKEIEMDGLKWGKCMKFPPAVDGSKLQIACTIEDEKSSIDDLIEKIDGFDNLIGLVEITASYKI
ncbi:Elongation factor 1-beta'-like protein [Aphelenchoides bicaudatus]|nr:Elongation factor 1-beta'-like protein [Aphelenchoides bicaudatus]